MSAHGPERTSAGARVAPAPIGYLAILGAQGSSVRPSKSKPFMAGSISSVLYAIEGQAPDVMVPLHSATRIGIGTGLRVVGYLDCRLLKPKKGSTVSRSPAGSSLLVRLPVPGATRQAGRCSPTW